ncbi:MAG: hypothetical protein ACOYLX_14085 [Burkholderiaceae bacterium]
MNSFLKAMPVVLVLACGISLARADDIERRSVQFAKGATSATVKGALTGDQTIDYVLRARAGQTLRVTLDTRSPSLYFNLLPPDSESALHIGSTAGNTWTGPLPTDGEYRVRTYLMRSAARRGEHGSFTLTLEIPPGGAASGQTGR